jgi:hypothetical protein
MTAQAQSLTSAVTRSMEEMVDNWQSQMSRMAHQYFKREEILLAEIQKLKHCNQELEKSIERESEIARISKDSLISGVTDLLSQFISQKDHRMSSILSNTQTEFIQRAGSLQALLDEDQKDHSCTVKELAQYKTETSEASRKLCSAIDEHQKVCSIFI